MNLRGPVNIATNLTLPGISALLAVDMRPVTGQIGVCPVHAEIQRLIERGQEARGWYRLQHLSKQLRAGQERILPRHAAAHPAVGPGGVTTHSEGRNRSRRKNVTHR